MSLGLDLTDGFQIEGTKASRIARWLERREARAFDELVTELRRKLTNRGVCRFCAREVGLLPGAVGNVTRYHHDVDGRPCVGRGRGAA
jgi:hypothetical protein